MTKENTNTEVTVAGKAAPTANPTPALYVLPDRLVEFLVAYLSDRPGAAADILKGVQSIRHATRNEVKNSAALIASIEEKQKDA